MFVTKVFQFLDPSWSGKVDDNSLFHSQLEESDKLFKRKQRFGVTVSSTPGDSTDVSLLYCKLSEVHANFIAELHVCVARA